MPFIVSHGTHTTALQQAAIPTLAVLHSTAQPRMPQASTCEADTSERQSPETSSNLWKRFAKEPRVVTFLVFCQVRMRSLLHRSTAAETQNFETRVCM